MGVSQRPRGPNRASPAPQSGRADARPAASPDAPAETVANALRGTTTDAALDASQRPSRTRPPAAPQLTVEILIPLCRQAEYEAAKAALWQWRTRWREEITYSFKSNLRRRADGPRASDGSGGSGGSGIGSGGGSEPAAPAGSGPVYLPTVWVIKASARSIAELPREYAHRRIADLAPRWGVIACVRDLYTDNGRGERLYGSKHFAVGTEVYPHPPFSGDGYERALFTGLHRQTKRFVTVMQPTQRFEDWRVGEISHPVVLHEFRSNGVWEHEGALEEARALAHRMNERIFHLKISRPSQD